MLLTIHDADMHQVAWIDNEKQETLNYYDDTWTRYLDTGASTFEFTVQKKAIKSDVGNKAAYSYLNERAFISFIYKGESFVFNVLEIEEDEHTIHVISENLNLELINEKANAYKAPRAMTLREYLEAMELIGFAYLKVGINELEGQTRSLEWEGRETKLARLISLANRFEGELDFETRLNKDGTIKDFIVNFYKANDGGQNQGVGKVRGDLILDYGHNLDKLTRHIDKREIANVVMPVGRDGLTIDGMGELKQYNAAGELEFYQFGSMLYAPLSAQRYPSTFTGRETSDRWIRSDIDVDTDNKDVLRATGLRHLKKVAYPAITYKLKGFIDADIGDTITVRDSGFKPLLLMTARVSVQKISFTDKTKNETEFDNFKALENRLTDGIQQALDRAIENAKTYSIKLETSNGVMFKDGAGESIVTPTLYRGARPISQNVSWSWFVGGVYKATGSTYKVEGKKVGDKLVLKAAAIIGGQTIATEDLTFVNVTNGEGVGIASTVIHYARGESGTEIPTSGWIANVPVVEDGRYLWTRTTWNYTNGTSKQGYSAAKMGERGAKGDQGNGVVSVANYYLATSADKDVTYSTTGWTTAVQQISQNVPYLWHYRQETFSNGSSNRTQPAIIGTHGKNGTPLYTWIKYADSPTSGMSDTPAGKQYIGIAYNKQTATESVNYADYSWSLIRGADGVEGPKGADGQTLYTWIKYADNALGAGMSDTPTGKRYLGLAVNRSTASRSNNPRDYEWSPLFENVKVGGRNLLRNSQGPFIPDSKPENFDNFEVYGRTSIHLTNGEKYLISAKTNGKFSDVHSGAAESDNVVLWFTDKVANIAAVSSPETGTVGTFFTWDKPTGDYYLRVNTYHKQPTIKVWDVKVEQGTVKTDYTIAPEDLQELFDAKADQNLTQQQLEALAERTRMAETEAKAAEVASVLQEWVKRFNEYMAEDTKGRDESEKKLIDVARRVEAITNDFGELSERWNFIDTYMKAAEEGLVIGKKDGTSSIRISDQRISMYSGNTEAMYISRGVLHIDNGVFTKTLQVGRFVMSQHEVNADMNVVRYVG